MICNTQNTVWLIRHTHKGLVQILIFLKNWLVTWKISWWVTDLHVKCINNLISQKLHKIYINVLHHFCIIYQRSIVIWIQPTFYLEKQGNFLSGQAYIWKVVLFQLAKHLLVSTLISLVIGVDLWIAWKCRYLIILDIG